MIERKEITNRRFMTGFGFEHSNAGVKVGEGTLDSFALPAVEFDLYYDSTMPVLHDLYIVEDAEGYDYRLMVTYLGGDTLAFYDQDGKLFHRLMTIKTMPDGSYRGDFVYINKFTPKEVDDGKVESNSETT
ncbi:hypothetical protein [Cytobacillus oceanisediminis]|uniref:hypothetical protein n=1 Tax=Cytobacillus oceanisediminis TaxID=665099 RepID=UPI00207A53AD|nr:hypothetical protein [Cytobacillus oceanisediminis]MBY0157265.1 hypothetical protein [Cytobacillus firmus]USK46283.1 hypothetical protein LIT27_10685 [Cytobacillus oceanisediminis]